MEAVARGLEAEARPLTASILMVAPPARGGMAGHVISLIAGLHHEGYGIGVACDKDSPIAQAARDRSLPVYPITIPSGTRPSRAAMAVLHVLGAISHLQAQVIHTHSFSAGLVGALAIPLARPARLVATIHNYPPTARDPDSGAEAGGQQGEKMRPVGAGLRWAIRQVVRRASRLITVSDALRRELMALYPEAGGKITTIPNGIELHTLGLRDGGEIRAELGIPAQVPLIGMVARLAPQKGIAEFLRACRQVADQWPEARFVVAGDGPLREAAQSLRDELGLSGQLHLLGEVESARELIAALDCLVVASTSEGSSVVAMEAMACEKPVVATRVGGVPEVVVDGETGILVRPGDAAALAEGVAALLRSPERGRAFGERGRRRAVEHFDVRLMLERTQQVYADLLREELGAGGRRG